MFGHKKLLTEGACARGVVTALTTIKLHDGAVVAWKFQTRVVFEDGSTVDETFTSYTDDWKVTTDAKSHELSSADSALFLGLGDRLQPGATVPVRYDPGNWKKIVLDLPALREEMAPAIAASQDAQAATDQKVARAVSELAGGEAGQGAIPSQAPSAGAPSELASDSIASILQQATSDPEGLRARMQAQGSGASAFVVTPGGLAGLGGTPVEQQPDIADQLSKLADLRDRGVLTDAEFEAQKQKLLGT
jgi:Short C-terminal domain